MMPHRLELAAFGPYAGHEVIDFDALAEIGLFVVSGPTGSGKSSIFNALCWALYGSFPGEFAGDRDIRSQHADDSDPCQVTLEFTAGGSRWKVTRRAQFERPKKTGDGTTVDGPEATLFRFRAGDWTPVLSKIRDVNERCEELVGLDLQQFQRVVLLPQGGFSRVLNADAKERQSLLRTLFSSAIYEQAVERLKAQSKEARDAISVQMQTREAQLAIAASSLESAMSAVGNAWSSGAEIARPDLDHAISVTLMPLIDAATEKRNLAKSAALAANEVLIEARGAAEDQQRLAQHQLELEGLEARGADVLASRAEAETALAAALVQSAYESEQKLLGVSQAKLTVRGQLQKDFDELRVSGPLPSTVSQDVLHEAGKQVESGRTAILRLIESAEALTKRRQEHAAARKELDASRTAHQAAQIAAEKTQSELQTLGEEVEKLKSRSQLRARDELRHEAARKARDRYAAWQSAADNAVKVSTVALSAGEQLDVLRAEQAQLRDARSATATKAERHIAEQQSVGQLSAQVAAAVRLVGLEEELQVINAAVDEAKRHHTTQLRSYDAAAASRLAESLADGEPCLVCGSLEHPAPALSVEVSTVQLSDVEEALRAQTASSEKQYSLLSQRDLAQETLKGLEDPSVDQLQQLLTAAEAQVAESAVAVEDTKRLTVELEQLERQLSELDGNWRGLTERANKQTTHADTLAGELGDLAKKTLDELDQAERAAAALLQEAIQATAELALKEAYFDEVDKRRIAEASTAEGLGDQVIARSAQLDQEGERLTADELTQGAAVGETALDTESHKLEEAGVVLSSLVAQLKESDLAAAAHATQAKVLTQTLRDSPFEAVDELAAVLREPKDIDRLKTIYEQWLSRSQELRSLITELQTKDLPEQIPDLPGLQAAFQAAEAESSALTTKVSAAEANLAAARSALSDVEDVDAALSTARTQAELLAHVANVSSGKNQKRIPLESWVLSAYLREVVGHANLHLLPMSSGRYRLVVADQTQDRRSKAGLDIEVHDEYTGKQRSAQSLSGGETFQASLALALGLADVVGAGRSGLHFDCVFVDEGFGSLDPDALDRAIDVLDGLRTRGALVGVITHVPALKDVLPVGIQVNVNSDGSGSTLQQLV